MPPRIPKCTLFLTVAPTFNSSFSMDAFRSVEEDSATRRDVAESSEKWDKSGGLADHFSKTLEYPSSSGAEPGRIAPFGSHSSKLATMRFGSTPDWRRFRTKVSFPVLIAVRNHFSAFG